MISLHFSGFFASTPELSANPRDVIGSVVEVCPNDNYTLIFVCKATGRSCRWWFDPFIPSNDPLTIRSQEQGDSELIDPVTVYVTKKIAQSSPQDFFYESQLHIPVRAIVDEQSRSFKVFCDIDRGDPGVISIIKLSKFVFTKSNCYYQIECVIAIYNSKQKCSLQLCWNINK